MKILGKLLLVAYIGLSLFGIFGMHISSQNQMDGCIAATFQDANCPFQVNSLNYLFFHLDAYRSFSFSFFTDNILNTLSFSFMLFVFIGLVVFYSNLTKIPELTTTKSRYRFRNSFFSHQKQKIIEWLSLFENSPTVFS
ncbi:MAG: hypothetical protein JJE53_01395 [Candidatus Pacebacteria bacterium]|nr:hypothetical protein [Candidatus Paceibacterota bacterium]